MPAATVVSGAGLPPGEVVGSSGLLVAAGETFYETWPGANEDPVPAERWDVPSSTDGTIEQTGTNEVRLLSGPNGGFNPNDGVSIRSTGTLTGEVRFTLRWGSSAGDDIAVQIAWCALDDQEMTSFEAYARDAYYMVLNLSNSTFALFKRVANVGDPLATGATFASAGLTAPAPGVEWDFALLADGANVSTWVWDTGDPRPETPTFTAADSTYDGTGKVRFGIPSATDPAGEVFFGPIAYGAAA